MFRASVLSLLLVAALTARGLPAGDQFAPDDNGYIRNWLVHLLAPDELTGLKLKMGSDDQAKVYLNGKEVLKCNEARPLEKDQDTAENITLKKGVNTLVFKIVNEGEDWSGSIRFLDKDGTPVRNFKVTLTPE